METYSTRRVLLAQRPNGALSRECFEVETVPCPALQDEQILIEAKCLSIDAFIRTVMYEEAYHGSLPVGGTLVALGVGLVLESRSPNFEVGDAVFGPIGAQTHAVAPASLFRKVDEEIATGAYACVKTIALEYTVQVVVKLGLDPNSKSCASALFACL